MEVRLMRSQFAFLIGVVAIVGWTVGIAGQDHVHEAAGGQHEATEHTHGDAAKLVNPVKPTDTSIAAGKKIYETQCATCHGPSGKGDGKMAASITGAKPSDLTDPTWKHGSSDGEIFTLIKDGSKGTGMRGYGSRLKPNDIWSVVNYIRTLGPAQTKSN
jgi:mono/diheme cytochrome c family protein